MSTEPGEKGLMWHTETQSQVLNPCCLKGNMWKNVTEKGASTVYKCLGVGGDLLALMWTELEGAVPVTCMCSFMSTPHCSLLCFVLQRTTFPRLPCPWLVAGSTQWEASTGNGIQSLGSIADYHPVVVRVFSMAPTTARHILYLVVLGPGLLESLCPSSSGKVKASYWC